MDTEFAKTGLFVRRQAGPTGLTRFQVLGERSSGTNLLRRLMIRNSGLAASGVLGWKHGFPQAVAIPKDLAVICVVRNPADWALSMHRRPWHATPNMQAQEFSAFIRAPWQTHVDSLRFFRMMTDPAIVGQPLQQDRDPVTGRPFTNLFSLRRAKLAGVLSYLGRDCTVAVVRLETLQADQQGVMSRLVTALGLTIPEIGIRPVTRRLGSKFQPAVHPRPTTPDRVSPQDRAFMVSQLDRAQEASLGYAL